MKMVDNSKCTDGKVLNNTKKHPWARKGDAGKGKLGTHKKMRGKRKKYDY